MPFGPFKKKKNKKPEESTESSEFAQLKAQQEAANNAEEADEEEQAAAEEDNNAAEEEEGEVDEEAEIKRLEAEEMENRRKAAEIKKKEAATAKALGKIQNSGATLLNLCFDSWGKVVQDEKEKVIDEEKVRSDREERKRLREEAKLASLRKQRQENSEEKARAKFMEYLVKRRKSSLRAWRVDIDRKNTNRVAYTDLMEACHHLGLTLRESRLVWLGWRPNKESCPATPIEFHEFDPSEWTNLNSLLELFWEEFNFDLDEAWDKIDADGNGFVDAEEWQMALDSFGFMGDAHQIFVGLDTCGQGRVWKHEMEYFKLLPPESHTKANDSPLVHELRDWCKKVWGTPMNLLNRLGMRTARCTMTTTSFSHKLKRINFPGDPLHTAMVVSKCKHMVAQHDLLELLSGGGSHAADAKKSVSYAGRHGNLVNNAPKYKLAADKTAARPSWDGGLYTPIEMNESLAPGERHYFSGMRPKPRREEFEAYQREKREKQAQQELQGSSL